MRSSVRRWALWGLAVYAVAAAIILLMPGSPSEAFYAFAAWLRDEVGVSWLRAGMAEFAANVLLFLPLGFLLTALWRRPWIGVMVAVIVSAGAELVQLVLPGRFASIRDVVANVTGAVLGAGIAWLILRRRGRTTRHASS